MSGDLRGYVTAALEGARSTAIGCTDSAVQLALSPDGTRLVSTARTVVAVDGDLRRVATVLDLATGQHDPVDDGRGETHGASWAPDGTRLAWIADGPGGAVARWGALGGPVSEVPCPVPGGHVEHVHWSPDGTALLLGTAEPGAEVSDVHGSGTLGEDRGERSWEPLVLDGRPAGGWRRLWVHDVAGGSSRQLSDPGHNVWEAAWAGAGAVVATVSSGPGESDWYAARLVLLDLGGGSAVLVDDARQVCAPAASPSGRLVSVIAGTMSDRGADSGDLLLVVPDAPARTVDTGGVDVTGQVWLDEDSLVFTGLRGLRTVVGRLTVSTGAVTELWDTEETSGDIVPEVAAAGDTVLVCRHSYRRPPALVRIRDGVEEVLADLAHAGSAAVAALAGDVEAVSWSAPDGTRVEGLLTTPPGDGPHPLVVHVHGGPVWAWRNAWSMQYPYTPLLVGRGYAVLHPNMRGSTGRGQQFVRAGLHDMGGVDAEDVLAGVDALVAAGRVDPARVAITGNSYGGFLAAWSVATSDRFAAAVARSPVTDWVSQHHASNLPGFDALCLAGDPLAADSPYRTRSPLYRAGDVRTPVMLMAGARDLATPPEQATMFHRAVVERGGDSTLVVYPEEGHGVRRHAALVDQCIRMLTFLERHVPTTTEARR